MALKEERKRTLDILHESQANHKQRAVVEVEADPCNCQPLPRAELGLLIPTWRNLRHSDAHEKVGGDRAQGQQRHTSELPYQIHAIFFPRKL